MPARFLLAEKYPIRRLSTPARYVVATAAIGLITLLRWWLDRFLGPVPFLLYFPGVIVIALYLDRYSSYYASVLSVLSAQFFFLPPALSLKVQELADVIALILFFLVLLFTSWLVENGRRLSLELDREQQEKSVLLQEMNHRTKNNIQMLNSLLLMQATKAQEPWVKAAFHDAMTRISVIGQLHQTLLGSGKANKVDAKEFLSDLCASLQTSYLGHRPVAVRVRAESWEIAMSRAVSLALIVNELVTNSLKHAFPEGRSGVVEVTLQRTEQQIRLVVEDDGVGYAPPSGQGGIGSQIVPLLARQLDGRVEVGGREGGGSRTVVTIPRQSCG